MFNVLMIQRQWGYGVVLYPLLTDVFAGTDVWWIIYHYHEMSQMQNK